MRGILRAIARALRAVMRRLKATAAWGAGVIDAGWASMFGGGYVEEMDEVADDATTMREDAPSAEAAHEAVARPAVPAYSPAVLVKRAVEMRSANKPITDIFDDRHPEQKRLRLYVEALDESGMRAIRCIPEHTLARHLDSSPFVAAGLRQIDQTIILAREAAEAKAQMAAAKPARRSRSSSILDTAVEKGRKLTLDEVISIRRRAA